jgi:GNAT superfamily N-acetyltransferase
MVTDPAHLRRGIGRALMAHIVEEAGRAGVSVLDCLATRTAVPFYRAAGFVALGPAEVSLAPGIVFPVVRMVRGGG